MKRKNSNKLKVLYDYQAFTYQNYGGVSRYFFELIKGMKKRSNSNVTITITSNAYLDNVAWKEIVKFPRRFKFKGKQRLFTTINKLFSIVYLKYGDYDIFHATHYDPYFIKHIGNKPFVITIHDMIHEKFTEQYANKMEIIENKKLLIHEAERIFAVSNNTKKDIVDIYGIDENKITVIYHGCDERLCVNKINPPVEDYILYVGMRGGYKNFKVVVESLALLHAENKTINLIVVGGGKFTTQEQDMFSKLGISKYVMQLEASDEYLQSLYKNALCFVYPSLYEGFGIPILEAFSFEAPLVCSNSSCLPEIAGDSALYFEPSNAIDLSCKIRSIINNNFLRTSLLAKGRKRLEKFSWNKTIDKTFSCYLDVFDEFIK